VLNYAVGTATEPGSTFKLPALMAAMDDGLANLSDTVDTYGGRTTFYGEPMHDSGYDKGEGHGVINVQEAFEMSSNIGTAKTIYKAYHHNPQRFLDKLNAMGLADSLGVSIKGEVSPKIRKQVGESGWSGITPTQMAIGYEITQTPLQILAYYNAVANDGRMMRPLFATHLLRNGKVIKEYEPEVINNMICSRRTIEAAQAMLKGVVERGTGKDAFKNTPYEVSGKTGTARVTRNGAYVASKYRASFCGYFPSDNPRYSCIVVIAEPTSGIYYASSVAAPVFKEIADKIYAIEFDLHEKTEAPAMAENYHMPVSKDGATHELIQIYDQLNIPVNHDVQSDWSRISTGKDSVEVKEKTFTKGLVPNVLGMGLQDALFLLENAGLQVKVVGHGTVKKQSIPNGARIKDYHSIIIELS
jgi:cell division protein FtsI (penicillin-binding protein 3)